MTANVLSRERWEKAVADYDLPHLRLRIVARLINESGAAAVVDLGCAKGTLKGLLGKTVSYTGCDFVAPEPAADFRFFQCDFNRERLPSELAGNQLFVCSGLLEYIENTPAFLSQISLLLPAGGKLLVSYFNMNHISRIWRRVTGRTVYFHPDWLGRYSLGNLRKILEASGFRIRKIHPVGQAFSHSAPAGMTVEEDDSLLRFRIYSPLLAHQFVLVCEKR